MKNATRMEHGLENLEKRVLFSTINVANYGAAPNDGRDDRPALLAAVKAARAGDVIQFNAGTFDISNKVEIPSGLTVKGSGTGVGGNTTLRSADGNFSLWFRGNGFKVSNVTFDGGALLMDVYNSTISNVTIDSNKFINFGRGGNNGAGNGAIGAPGNRVLNFTMTNNSFQGNGRGHGLYIYTGNDWNISDNEFFNMNSSIKSNNAGNKSYNIRIQRNYFTQNNYHAVELQGTVNTFWFTDNYYEKPRLSSVFSANDSTFAFSLIYTATSSDQHILRNFVNAPERPDGVGVRMAFEAGENGEVRDNYVRGCGYLSQVYGPNTRVSDNNVAGLAYYMGWAYGPGSNTSSFSNNGPNVSLSWNINRPRPGPNSGQTSAPTPPPVAPPTPTPAPAPTVPPSSPTPPPAGGTWLSDIAVASARNGWGSYEKDRSNGESSTGDGRQLSIRGAKYTKGLGVHAGSELTFNLNGGYSSFFSDIGVDDEVNGMGSVVFQVVGDGRVLYDSGAVDGRAGIKNVNVSIAGVKQLALRVNSSNGTLDFDHADWAGAKLLGAGSPAPTPAPLPTPAPVPAPAGGLWLSDLTPIAARNGWGPYEEDRSNAESKAGDGRQLSIRGTKYDKGFGVHAGSELTFNLEGKYSTFFSNVGIDDETSGRGTVIFQVVGDGKVLYDSGVVDGRAAVKTVNVSVAGVDQLSLRVSSPTSNIDYDHGDWAGAKLA